MAEELTTEDQVPEEAEDQGDEPMSLENARKLRRENAALRQRAKDAEDRADQTAFRAQVEATGRLVNCEEMPFNPELLDNPEALNSAIDELVQRKPYLVPKKFGEVGQGQRNESAPADFSMLLK